MLAQEETQSRAWGLDERLRGATGGRREGREEADVGTPTAARRDVDELPRCFDEAEEARVSWGRWGQRRQAGFLS